MLFNSIDFIFIFLPVCFFVFVNLKKKNIIVFWLSICSIFFYSYWNINFVWVIFLSMIINFYISLKIKLSKIYLILGIIFNLLLLFYFKYSILFFNNDIIPNYILPLGISFFTFQQIAFLMDVKNLDTKEITFVKYFLFVTFFPQLIAGPIVKFKFFYDQLDKFFFSKKKIFLGLTIFFIGLFKKTVFADNLAFAANSVFNIKDASFDFSIFETWMGIISYSCQLYFDFSGYCDMALGLGMIFSIILPLNFNSPYKSSNIIDFWANWNITLTNFFKVYFYNNILKELSKFSNFYVCFVFGTLLYFLVIGIWHGAGINFVLFGIGHGVIIIFYRFFTNFLQNYPFVKKKLNKFIAIFINFIIVSLLWILFRAENFLIAKNIFSNAFSFDISLNLLNSVSISLIPNLLFELKKSTLILLISLIFIFVFPNTYDFFYKKKVFKIKKIKIKFKDNFLWVVFMAIIASFAIININDTSDFLYFQF